MRKKRSKFLTFMFSLVPGAGHMFMGFMKLGISLMSAFTTIIFFAAWLDISPLLFVLPVLWFYSFFDCINRRYVSDEEFEQLDDSYLFSIDKLVSVNLGIFQKRRLFAGVLILLLGIYLIWKSIINSLWRYIPDVLNSTIHDITRIMPQMVLGTAIVIIGIKLIMGKKRESDNNV
jgi:hypothetical protein